jgi:hypothetical protein
MLKVNQRFDKHFSCHLQGEYLMVRRFWQLKSGLQSKTVSSSVPLISTIKSNSPPTACPIYKAAKNVQPLHTQPEDDNRNVCRNDG